MKSRIQAKVRMRMRADRALDRVCHRRLPGGWFSRWVESIHPLSAIVLGFVLTVGMVLVIERWPGPEGARLASTPLLFLIPVLVTSTLGGLIAGVCTAVVAAAAWNWYFLPPIQSLGASPGGWFTLVLFLVVATLAGQVSRLTRRVVEHKRIAEAVQQSEQRYRAFFDLNAVGAAEVGLPDGRYLRINDAYCHMLGYRRDELLTRRFADMTHPDDREEDLRQFARLVRGEIPSYQLEKRYIRKDGSIVWGQLTATLIKDSSGQPVSEVGMVLDVTERKRAEEELRRLSARLLHSQDEERRRIAQGLHEETAQALVASNLNLADLLQTQATLDDEVRSRVGESLEIGEQVLEEIRTLSYVLHPPLLEELGLASALVWYVDGFRQLSGVEVELTLPPALDRLPSEVEMALFRVVQESLINIYRHAGSERAWICLGREDGRIILEVKDQGRGMAAETTRSSETVGHLGVGIAGMRQRVHQLGGQLDLSSGRTGTTVTAVVPTGGAMSPE